MRTVPLCRPIATTWHQIERDIEQLLAERRYDDAAQAAEPAIRVCRQCPLLGACRRIPMRGYTGVHSARLLHNGHPINTTAARKDHAA